MRRHGQFYTGFAVLLIMLLLSGCAITQTNSGEPSPPDHEMVAAVRQEERPPEVVEAEPMTQENVTAKILERQAEYLLYQGLDVRLDPMGHLVVRLSDKSLVFKTGKATLTPSAQQTLQHIANVLHSYPETRVAIAGYTDSTGGKKRNLVISQARAEAVANYLLALNVAPRCLVNSTGYGEDHPLFDNQTKEGQQRNRRVELGLTIDAAEALENERLRNQAAHH